MSTPRTNAVVIGGTGRLGPIWCETLARDGYHVTKWNEPDFDITRDHVWWCVDAPNPDVVVINAGIDHRPNDPAPQADRLASVNLLGTWRALDYFGGLAPGASIICIASLYALVAGPHKHPLYGATKAGVTNLVKHYAVKYGPRGVRVNALALGGVQDDQDPAFITSYASKVPLGRMAQPEDITGPLLFLASDASRYVTGTTLVVDGGYTCL